MRLLPLLLLASLSLTPTAWSKGIQIIVNDSSAASLGSEAREMLNELIALGAPKQGTGDYFAYNASGRVWSTPASCDKRGQIEMRIEDLVSNDNCDPTKPPVALPEISSGCADGIARGAKHLDHMLAAYTAKDFSPEGHMSQTIYYFSASCHIYGPKIDEVSCDVEISNGNVGIKTN